MTGNLADHLFLVCHDERTGRARVPDDVLGAGLGAALLGELLFPPERLRLADDGAISPVAHQGPPPADPLGHRVWNLVRREHRPRDVGAWIDILAADARDQVGARLVDLAVVERVVDRRTFRSSRVAYPAISPDWVAYATSVRLHGALHMRPMNTWDALLAALAHGVGLLQRVASGCEAPHPRFGDLAAVLPPPLQTLLRHAWTAIAKPALSLR